MLSSQPHRIHARHVALVLTAWAVAGCARTGDAAHDSASDRAATPAAGFVDDFGDTLHVREARRIVSLSPTTTELLYTIGAGERVVGRTRYDVWPAAAKRVTDLGPGLRPNIELVMATRPDLVVLYAANDNRPAARALHAAGIATLSLKIDRIADFDRAAAILGDVTGRRAAADATADSVERTLARVRSAVATLPRPRVLWFLWDNPPLVLGHASYQSELLDIAGGVNVYDDWPDAAAKVSLEDVLRRDPEVILADPGADVMVNRSTRWRGVRAVRDGRVYAINDTLLNRPGVTLGMAAASLARLLHPGWEGP
ncbi:MAG TPA: helical backbone metal receptor [Gemmatimonadaceae bacterium]|nr:helical backbone metal receptor [Gemmatimonadaceae bacterium]